MKVWFTPEARLAVREKRAWWEANRDKAPSLFRDELAAVVAKLRDSRDQERHEYAVRRGRIIWRLLMPRTQNHVYYRVDDASGIVEVLLVWSAVGGRRPDSHL